MGRKATDLASHIGYLMKIHQGKNERIENGEHLSDCWNSNPTLIFSQRHVAASMEAIFDGSSHSNLGWSPGCVFPDAHDLFPVFIRVPGAAICLLILKKELQIGSCDRRIVFENENHLSSNSCHSMSASSAPANTPVGPESSHLLL
jgi:hypothetical protein